MFKKAKFEYTIGGGVAGALAGLALTKLTEDESKKATLADYLQGGGIGLGVGAAGGGLLDYLNSQTPEPATDTDKTETKDSRDLNTKPVDTKEEKVFGPWIGLGTGGALAFMPKKLGAKLEAPFVKGTRNKRIQESQRRNAERLAQAEMDMMARPKDPQTATASFKADVAATTERYVSGLNKGPQKAVRKAMAAAPSTDPMVQARAAADEMRALGNLNTADKLTLELDQASKGFAKDLAAINRYNNASAKAKVDYHRYRSKPTSGKVAQTASRGLGAILTVADLLRWWREKTKNIQY